MDRGIHDRDEPWAQGALYLFSLETKSCVSPSNFLTFKHILIFFPPAFPTIFFSPQYFKGFYPQFYDSPKPIIPCRILSIMEPGFFIHRVSGLESQGGLRYLQGPVHPPRQPAARVPTHDTTELPSLPIKHPLRDVKRRFAVQLDSGSSDIWILRMKAKRSVRVRVKVVLAITNTLLNVR